MYISNSFNQEEIKAFFGDVDLANTRGSKPLVCKWFQDKGIKILEIACGDQFVVCKAQEKNKKLAFYAFAYNRIDKCTFGGEEN